MHAFTLAGTCHAFVIEGRICFAVAKTAFVCVLAIAVVGLLLVPFVICVSVIYGQGCGGGTGIAMVWNMYLHVR